MDGEGLARTVAVMKVSTTTILLCVWVVVWLQTSPASSDSSIFIDGDDQSYVIHPFQPSSSCLPLLFIHHLHLLGTSTPTILHTTARHAGNALSIDAFSISGLPYIYAVLYSIIEKSSSISSLLTRTYDRPQGPVSYRRSRTYRNARQLALLL